MFRFFIFCFILLISKLAWSYPQYVSYGYRSCLTCHYNPMGNGPLTDYGRAVSATAVSDRMFISKKTSEEQLAQRSAANFKGWKKNTWFRPSASYRGLTYVSNLGDDTQETEFLNMVAEVTVVTKFLKRDRLIAVADIGYSPQGSDEDALPIRTREHYIGYRFNKFWGAYLGMLDKAFGIRLVDHRAYSRLVNSIAENDQTHGLMIHYSDKKLEGAIHGFLGNLFNDKDVRQVGLSTTGEFSLTKKVHLGASFMTSSSDYKDIFSMALHGRFALGKGNAVLTELGRRNETKSNEEATAYYAILRGQTELKRGVFLNLGTEFQDSDKKYLKFMGGLQWFPIQRLEFELDISNERSYSTSDSSSYALSSQIHLWL